MRIGYRYLHNAGDDPDENRGVLEVTPRYPLVRGVLVSNRNRIDFRFIEGEYSWRYRNRLSLEREVSARKKKRGGGGGRRRGGGGGELAACELFNHHNGADHSDRTEKQATKYGNGRLHQRHTTLPMMPPRNPNVQLPSMSPPAAAKGTNSGMGAEAVAARPPVA